MSHQFLIQNKCVLLKGIVIIILDCRPFSLNTLKTRQLSYRKEDRAMRPICGCPEKFPESLLCTRLLFSKFVMFQSILRMCVQNLTFVALPVPEIIGGTPKIWAVPVHAHAPFSPQFLIGFCSYGRSEYICQI